VVHRPSLHPSPTQRAVGRNLTLDLIAAVGVGVSTAVINSLLPTIARRGGLEPIGLSALAAAPFIANFLGIWAGRFGPRTPKQLALTRGVGMAALVALLFVATPLVMIVVAVVFWISLSFGGPFQLRLWGAMYPPRILGRVVGVIGTGRAAAGGIAALAGGLVADQFGGPLAVAIAGVVGVLCAFAYAGFRAGEAAPPPRFSARDTIRVLRERPILGRLALAQGFYGGGLIAAAPLYALVYVDRLNLSLADVGVIGILTAAATTVSSLIWGVVSDRRGARVVLRVGTAIGLISLVVYAFAPQVVFLWIASIAGGTSGASIDVGLAAVMSDNTPMSARSAASAGWNAITGVRGIFAAFLMSALLQIGLVNVTTGLLLCAASTAVGVYLYGREGVAQESEATTSARAVRAGWAARSARAAQAAGVSRVTRVVDVLRSVVSR
jgi:MFS transporter, DHA1 family, staphyloferrin B biosynthesis exporter